mgnify:CR=1 FL=1
MSKVRIGLAGLGRLGIEYAQNIQYKSPNAKLIAVCSLVKDELAYAKDKLGVEMCFSSFEEMVEKSNLDAVAILTPTKYHAQQIIFSLKKFVTLSRHLSHQLLLVRQKFSEFFQKSNYTYI